MMMMDDDDTMVMMKIDDHDSVDYCHDDSNNAFKW
jgi:hypothetical protein